ncbi:MAG: prephenate dehydrogenase/arogenate dehydrogenase family protein [Burkholderiaceae bacterium]
MPVDSNGRHFDRIAVLGLGLIGGSVAAAIRTRKLAGQVVGFAVAGHAQKALSLGLIDTAAPSLCSAVSDADLVVIATPVPTIGSVLGEVTTYLSPTAIVTDCASTKVSTIAAARQHLGEAFERFVPGHPISGSEFSGPSAARSDLFQDKLWLLAPTPDTNEQAIARVGALVMAIGARCDQIDPVQHDVLFAEYSHAPHALVYAICHAVANGPNAARLSELAGAGFKDTTRIGATAPTLWSDILLDNRLNVLDSVDRYIEAMVYMRSLLESSDRDRLLELLEQAASWRQGLNGEGA